jgi:hypothetical protein
MCFALAKGAIRPRLRKCLHLYFYVIDRELGFIHIRLHPVFGRLGVCDCASAVSWRTDAVE